MDFVDDGLRREFTFSNPNSAGACGCGTSFHVKPNVTRQAEQANAEIAAAERAEATTQQSQSNSRSMSGSSSAER